MKNQWVRNYKNGAIYLISNECKMKLKIISKIKDFSKDIIPNF